MPAILKKISTITEKGQITVPKPVRDALGVGYGGRVVFCVDENLHVSIERAGEDGEDMVIDSFLSFLAEDMKSHPEHIRDFPPALLEQMAKLTEGMRVDLDEPIIGDVDL